jgi:hypothetical protein
MVESPKISSVHSIRRFAISDSKAASFGESFDSAGLNSPQSIPHRPQHGEMIVISIEVEGWVDPNAQRPIDLFP